MKPELPFLGCESLCRIVDLQPVLMVSKSVPDGSILSQWSSLERLEI